MNENALPLIDKLIILTKTNRLLWIPFSDYPTSLKPVKIDLFSQTPFDECNIIIDSSFSCDKGGTFFFLMAWFGAHESYLTLLAQTADSLNSKVYATTCTSNENEASELKRLYNLVDSFFDPIDINIQKFIDL